MGRGAHRVFRPVVIPAYSKKPLDTIFKHNGEMQIEMSLSQAFLYIILTLRLNDSELLAWSQ
jgi:hypothetical protein